jgi:hypothetical protein
MTTKKQKQADANAPTKATSKAEGQMQSRCEREELGGR